MKRFFLVSVLSLFAVGAILVAQVSAQSGSGVDLRQQASCEEKMLQLMGAREVNDGPLYQISSEIAFVFGRSTPRLYFTPRVFGIRYIAGSVFTDGRGKILFAEGYLGRLANVEAVRGHVAHEVAHVVKDDGAFGCDDYIPRDIKLEKAVDALAAETIGYQYIRAWLIRLKELDLSVDDVDVRLEALGSE
ncbi:MAG: hypothetical protein Q7S34_02485 [bacterium]|nr:hypothetical protein [bacterium]